MNLNALDRLMKQVSENDYVQPGMLLPCWDWTGSMDAKQRPRFYRRESSQLARRALMEMLSGEKLPDGCAVMTLCRNSACLRPDHLVFCNKFDADVLGQHGRVGPGDLALMRTLYEQGYDEIEIAVLHNISVPLVEAAIHEMDSLDFE